MIPQIRHVILWKRFKTALQKASGYNHYLLLSLLLRDANSTLVLFPGDSFDLHTTAAAATVAWLHNKYVEFLARPASSKEDVLTPVCQYERFRNRALRLINWKTQWLPINK